MKKIFAIALALVMVLSMASAFALTCNGTYDWACATTTYNCGKAKIEVVPFVRTNDACDTANNFVQSNCAAAVVGERVYYGLKLTLDANLSEEWWDAASTKLVVEAKNVSETENGAAYVGGEITLPTYTELDTIVEDITEKGGVLWLASDWTWDADKDFAAVNVFNKWVVKSGAKICAKLTSSYSPVDGYVEVSKWNVIYRAADSNLVFDIFDGTTWKYSAAIVHFNSDDKVEWVASDYDGLEKFVAWDGDMLVKEDGTRVGTSCGNAAKVAEVLKYFNLNFGTCITEKAIKANLGWKDEVESCFTWSKNAQAVVDAECVVAIPKTGDASVLAWLF